MEKRHTVYIVYVSLAPAWQAIDKASPPIASQALFVSTLTAVADVEPVLGFPKNPFI